MSKKITDIIILAVLLVLAIWLSPFIILGVIAYLIYRIRKMVINKKLLEQVKTEWLLKGKHTLFLYSNSEKWKQYFETDLIPKINDKAIVWNWSTRLKDGWNNDILEAKILRQFKPIGYFYPMAIVFLPNGEVKTFQFYTPYVQMLKTGKNEGYKKFESDFLKVANSI